MESVVNELCNNIFGVYPTHLEKCSVGMVNIVYIVTVCNERYVVRLNKDKGAYSDSIDLLKQAHVLGLPVSQVLAICLVVFAIVMDIAVRIKLKGQKVETWPGLKK